MCLRPVASSTGRIGLNVSLVAGLAEPDMIRPAAAEEGCQSAVRKRSDTHMDTTQALRDRHVTPAFSARCSTGAGDGCDLFGIRRSITMMMAGVARATYMLLMPNGSPSKYQTDVTTQVANTRPCPSQ